MYEGQHVAQLVERTLAQLAPVTMRKSSIQHLTALSAVRLSQASSIAFRGCLIAHQLLLPDCLGRALVS